MNLTDTSGQRQNQQAPWPFLPDPFALGMFPELEVAPVILQDEVKFAPQFSPLLTISTIDRMIETLSASDRRRPHAFAC
jgi:hypothetical protein